MVGPSTAILVRLGQEYTHFWTGIQHFWQEKQCTWPETVYLTRNRDPCSGPGVCMPLGAVGGCVCPWVYARRYTVPLVHPMARGYTVPAYHPPSTTRALSTAWLTC